MRRPVRLRQLIVWTAVASTFAGPARAAVHGEGTSKSIEAVRTPMPPELDGDLDEPPWELGESDDRFRQVYPVEDTKPVDRTEVTVLFDDEAIYVGLRMHDASPREIGNRVGKRDVLGEADSIEVILDPDHDHATAFSFSLSAAGVQADGIYSNDREFNAEWDTIWDGAARIDDEGWSAELRIPFRALRYRDGRDQTWGLQVKRYTSRRKETDLWTFVAQGELAVVSRAGHLKGIEIRSGLPLELRPFVAGRVGIDTEGNAVFGLGGGDSESSFRGDAGATLKVGLTSSLTMDAAVNPDFGQVEQDAATLNLTRFDAYFPEKRPFFYEGAEIFETPISLYYSRRIGDPIGGADENLNKASRNVTRIWNATKITGRVGKSLDVGIVGAVTGAEQVSYTDARGVRRTIRLSDPRIHGVGRFRLQLGDEGAKFIGMMATASSRMGGRVYEPGRNHDAYAQSIDGQWQSEDGSARLSGQAVVTELVGGNSGHLESGAACDVGTPGCTPLRRQDGTLVDPSTPGYAASLHAEKIGRTLGADLVYTVHSPQFDVNALGFAQSFNRHDVNARFAYRKVEPFSIFQNGYAYLGAAGAIDYDGVWLSRGLTAAAQGTYRNFWEHNLAVTGTLPGTWLTYEAGDGARFEQPPRLDVSSSIVTDSRKRFVFTLVGAAGADAREARTVSGTTGVVFQTRRLRAGLEAIGGIAQHDHLLGCFPCLEDSRTYTAAQAKARYGVFTARGSFAFTPRISLSTFAEVALLRDFLGDYREIISPTPYPFLRYDDLRPSPYTGDFDGDGDKDDDYTARSLKLNVVFQWELRTGSTLYLVYTRNQAAFEGAGISTNHGHIAGLAFGPTEEVLLAKLELFTSR